MTSTSVSVRLSEQVFEKLTEQAKAGNKKVSDLMRELIESGLKQGGKADDSAVIARVDQLEEAIRGLLGVEDGSVMTRMDAVNADFWQANTALSHYLVKAIETAAEARYFARLAAMYGIDVAHFVAQKTEIGVTPKPPVKEDRDKQMAFYEKKCRGFVREVMREIVDREPGVEEF